MGGGLPNALGPRTGWSLQPTGLQRIHALLTTEPCRKLTGLDRDNILSIMNENAYALKQPTSYSSVTSLTLTSIHL